MTSVININWKNFNEIKVKKREKRPKEYFTSLYKYIVVYVRETRSDNNRNVFIILLDGSESHAQRVRHQFKYTDLKKEKNKTKIYVCTIKKARRLFICTNHFIEYLISFSHYFHHLRAVDRSKRSDRVIGLNVSVCSNKKFEEKRR